MPRKGELGTVIEVKDVLRHWTAPEDIRTLAEFPLLGTKPTTIIPRAALEHALEEIAASYEVVYPHSLQQKPRVVLSKRGRTMRISLYTAWLEISTNIDVLASDTERDYKLSCDFVTLTEIVAMIEDETLVLSSVATAKMIAINDKLIEYKDVYSERVGTLDNWQRITVYSFIAQYKNSETVYGVEGAAIIRLFRHLHKTGAHHVALADGDYYVIVRTEPREEGAARIEYVLTKNIALGE